MTVLNLVDLAAAFPATIVLLAIHDYCSRRERAKATHRDYDTTRRTSK